MTILGIKTDQPEAYLVLHDTEQVVAEVSWQAHRELSATIIQKIQTMLGECSKKVTDLDGIIVFQGPGSFTGLRIGVTVANTLAYSLQIPVVGAKGDVWLTSGLQGIEQVENTQIVVPEYGAEPNITKPRK